jgi:hypothetical protein
VVLIFLKKKKFAGLGGVKGGSHEYILHRQIGDNLLQLVWVGEGSFLELQLHQGCTFVSSADERICPLENLHIS